MKHRFACSCAIALMLTVSSSAAAGQVRCSAPIDVTLQSGVRIQYNATSIGYSERDARDGVATSCWRNAYSMIYSGNRASELYGKGLCRVIAMRAQCESLEE